MNRTPHHNQTHQTNSRWLGCIARTECEIQHTEQQRHSRRRVIIAPNIIKTDKTHFRVLCFGGCAYVRRYRAYGVLGVVDMGVVPACTLRKPDARKCSCRIIEETTSGSQPYPIICRTDATRTFGDGQNNRTSNSRRADAVLSG